jgi:mono/diheme cytochrome c family protein
MNPTAESASPLRTRVMAVVAVLAASVLVAACSTTDDDETTENADTQASPATQKEEQPLDPEAEEGRELFVDNCGTCHTLDAAGTDGSIGPNLDEAQVDEAEVLEVIANGGRGSGNMPANLVTGADAQAVAKFVADSGPGT